MTLYPFHQGVSKHADSWNFGSSGNGLRTFQVHNPETTDCIRALTGLEADGRRSIEMTNAAMGITKTYLLATTQPIALSPIQLSLILALRQ